MPTIPPAPICLAGDRGAARTYAETLRLALADPDGGWTRAQRQTLRARYRVWRLRALGEDPHFDHYGSFRWPWGSRPPTRTDITVATWRRDLGVTKAEQKRRQVPSRLRQPRYR